MNATMMIRLTVLLSALASLSLAAAQPAVAQSRFDSDYGVGQARTRMVNGVAVVQFEKGAGDPVVFFYPGMDQRYWQWQVEAAAERYRAITIAFAPSTTGLPFDLLSTKELAAALEGLGLGPVHLVAHSIAAWQAMLLASTRPELFRTLVLEEPAVGLRDATPDCTLTSASDAELAQCRFSSLVHGPGWFERQSPELRRYLTDYGVGTPQPDDRGEVIDPAATEFPSICEDVRALPMPILFIRGAETPAHFQRKLDAHEACLPRHETVRITGASHSVHVDRPSEYNAAVLGLLGEVDR